MSGGGYQPVYRSILDSSIARDHVVRHCFEDLLKLADFKTGVVDMTHSAIARRTNVPEEMVRHAIAELEQPDPESRNRTAEGRRIVRLDESRPWGWRIVNYLQYRHEVVLEGKRRRQAAYRERHKGKKPVTEGASRSDAKRRARKTDNSVARVTEGRIKNEELRMKKVNTKPPSRSTAKDGARALFERLREEAGGDEFFEQFMEDEKTRIARELMAERPAVFENVSAEDVLQLWNGGTLRGTNHDRRALLLWARDPDSFMEGAG